LAATGCIGWSPEDGRLYVCDIDNDTATTAFMPAGVQLLKEFFEEHKAQRAARHRE
jgi:hypothetical protein